MNIRQRWQMWRLQRKAKALEAKGRIALAQAAEARKAGDTLKQVGSKS